MGAERSTGHARGARDSLWNEKLTFWYLFVWYPFGCLKLVKGVWVVQSPLFYRVFQANWQNRTIYHHRGAQGLADPAKAMVDMILLCFPGCGYLP